MNKSIGICSNITAVVGSAQCMPQRNQMPPEDLFNERMKTRGRNDQCACGSGKKVKRCGCTVESRSRSYLDYRKKPIY